MPRPCRVLRSAWRMDRWLARPPTVDEVRPDRCPGCDLRHGAGCKLHGHGVRVHTVWGPPHPLEAPTRVCIQARRYRCTACGCTATVVPREIQPHHHYSRPAMLTALALWSFAEVTGGEVRAQISPDDPRGFSAPHIWPSLRRWVRDRDRLWPEVRVPARPTHRQTAGALVRALCARLARPPPVPEVTDAWEAASRL